MVRHQNKEMNKADIMITCKGLVFLNNMSKLLFHHALHTHTHTHTRTHTCICTQQSYLISTCTLTFSLKENKSRGKWINYKRGCRALRRNQNSFRLNLGFPINVASGIEVEVKDKKIRVKQSISNRGKRPVWSSFFCESFTGFWEENGHYVTCFWLAGFLQTRCDRGGGATATRVSFFVNCVLESWHCCIFKGNWIHKFCT